MRRRSKDAFVIAVVVALALVAAGCGSRRTHADFVEAARGTSGGAVGVGTVQDDAASTATNESIGAGAGDGTDAGSTSGSAGAGPSAGGTTGSGSGSGAAPSAGGNEPILIGSVGNYSGPAGSAQQPGAQAVQVWARWVNDHGGLKGHQVKLFVVDDGSDPSRHIAAVKDLVENKHVVAFVGQYASQTHQAAKAYLESKRVPVIGGELSIDLWFTSPMYFPQGAAFDTLVWGELKTASRFLKGKKLGSLVCREAQVCTDGAADTKKHAAEHGFDLVYEGQGSIAQPDFTAECLAARNAGVEVLAPIFDVNSMKRLARSCSQQGYKPEFIVISGDSSLLSVPEFDGSVTATHVVPYGLDTPLNEQYHAAFKEYAPGTPLGAVQANGWAAAKVFEKAVAGAAEPISTASILESLWGFRGETLGGLLSPLSFTRNQPAPAPKCIFAMVQKGGQFNAPDGTKPTCRP